VSYVLSGWWEGVGDGKMGGKSEGRMTE